MQKILLGLLTFFFLSSYAVAGQSGSEGMITIPSAFDVKTTIDKLEKSLKAKGMTIFARIDHSAGAKKVGKKLLPTQVLIFGNPKVGTLLMQCDPQSAIDLPQKALVWQDSKGKTHLSYNDPAYLKKRHHLKGCDKAITKISKVLALFAKMATQK